MDNSVSNNIELASMYRLTATSFRMSAELLERSFGDKAEEMPYNYRAMPFYYLISHASELLLKAALLKRGVTPQQLRRAELRHNLQALLEQLESQGVNIPPISRTIVCGLSGQHKEHDLRYTTLLDDGKLTYTPEPVDVYRMLDDLLMATRLQLQGRP
jgi:hypothetical protein